MKLTSGSIGGSFGTITTSSAITGSEFITGDITIGSSKKVTQEIMFGNINR